jgi:hypothetical protein
MDSNGMNFQEGIEKIWLWAVRSKKKNIFEGETIMEKLITVCAMSALVFAMSGLARAEEIPALDSPECVPPPSDQVSWWLGDGNADDIVSGNNGILQGGVTFAAGKVGQAFSLDGVDDYIKVPDSSNLDITDTITLDAWIYRTKSYAYQAVVGKWSGNPWPYAPGPDAQRSYLLYLHTADTLGMVISTNGGQGSEDFAQVIGGTVVPLNTWVHVAGTYDGSLIKIYLNGNLDGSFPYNQPIFDSSSPVRIGTYVAPGYSQPRLSFGGKIDEVEIFNRALSIEEIQAIYNAGKAIEVEIDIKPGSSPNAINMGSHGLIPVAIFSEVDFDATTVDADTIELSGLTVAARGKGNKLMAHTEDVDGDGLLDLVVHVATANFDPESQQNGVAVLTGETSDGEPIEGSDEITLVPLDN